MPLQLIRNSEKKVLLDLRRAVAGLWRLVHLVDCFVVISVSDFVCMVAGYAWQTEVYRMRHCAERRAVLVHHRYAGWNTLDAVTGGSVAFCAENIAYMMGLD